MNTDDQHVLSLLRKLDSPDHREFPDDYEAAVTRARFDGLAALLDEKFDCVCDVDRGVEDAGFHGSIVIPAAATESDAFVVVRLSNFGLTTASAGGLARDSARAVDDLREEDRERIEAVSSALGCTFVPGHILRRAYDGPSELEDWQELWWHRFFDYV
ncbi:hypothetical protein [Streptomyces sp. ISL-11]|uniref:hypothetical protein n=1 Tax=Streptomyces sp. ISL-11 TaxID=2819174 RepID=UPI001BE6F51F|nr:hypothetical protein [Streptomyces sp. ISL-11]MBT2387698.1 hypothetical protein [Streptomyces sp. ISL-11]